MLGTLVCPAGLECPTGMARAPDLFSDPCRIGYYCLRGDVSAYPTACPAGTFNPLRGLRQLADCTPCTAGYYCNASGLSAPSGPCPGGYYCPTGTGNPNSFPCPIGFYRNGAAKESFEDCSDCMSGFFCDVVGLQDPKVSICVSPVNPTAELWSTFH